MSNPFQENQGGTRIGSDGTILSLKTILKGFIDTVEEIPGLAESTVSMEKLGFRTGKLAAGQLNGNQNIHEIIKGFSALWVKVGWGRVEIENFCEQDKTVLLKVTNIEDVNGIPNREASHRTLAPLFSFIPSYLAGLLSVLLRENMWYEQSNRQNQTENCYIFRITRSAGTPTRDLHTALKSTEQEQIHRLEMLVRKGTAELSNVIKELSSPVIPVLNHTVVIPLFGKFEDPHATELNEKILNGIIQYEAKYLLLDLTAVKELDEFLPSVIHNLTNSIRLLGAETFLVGISPDISTGIVRNQMDLSKFKCFTSLQHALQYTLFIEGLEITKR